MTTPDIGTDPAFPCETCGKMHVWPFEAAKCDHQGSGAKPVISRAERLLLRLLAMVDPECADTAGEIAGELLEALRK